VHHRRLATLYALAGISLGLILPFTVPLLAERGLGAVEIGLVMSLTGVAALVSYPVWGAIADGWLGRRRTVAVAAVLAAVGGVSLMLAGDDPPALALALTVVIVGTLAWNPLIDALALAVLGDGSSDYGRLRLWGSLGWAASALAAGVVWTLVGPTPVFLAFVVAALVVGGLVLLPLRAKVGSDAGGDGSGGDDVRPPLRSWLPLVATPLMLGFLLGLLVTSLGEHASWRFIGLRILDQGGGVFLIGLAASLPALVEVPVFLSSRRLAGRFGLRRLFVGGAAVAALIMGLIAVAPEPWMVAGLRTLDGVSYAMRYTAMVLIVGALLPRSLFAFGQSVAWFVYAGIAPIVADAAGGLIYETFGAEALFLATMVALAVGGAIVWLVLRGLRFGPQGPLPAVAAGSVAPPPAGPEAPLPPPPGRAP
jgi:PPP family 3-phenylpropionic acid transporter